MLNKCTFIGRLGKDPEVRNLDSGVTVATFSIATTMKWKDSATGEKKEATEWHNLVAWRGLAEIAQKYLHKGDLIYCVGRHVTRSWEKDGVTRYTSEFVLDEMIMLSTKKSDDHSGAPERTPPPDKGKGNTNKKEPDQGNFTGGSPADNSGATDDLPF